MICERNGGGVLSNHCQNPSRPSGSSRSDVNAARNCLSCNNDGTRVNVAFARRSRVRHAIRNVSSILGAAVAPFIAVWLWQAGEGSPFWVGVYLSVMSGLTLISRLLGRETKDVEMDDTEPVLPEALP